MPKWVTLPWCTQTAHDIDLGYLTFCCNSHLYICWRVWFYFCSLMKVNRGPQGPSGVANPSFGSSQSQVTPLRHPSLLSLHLSLTKLSCPSPHISLEGLLCQTELRNCHHLFLNATFPLTFYHQGLQRCWHGSWLQGHSHTQSLLRDLHERRNGENVSFKQSTSSARFLHTKHRPEFK